jgi:membrane protein
MPLWLELLLLLSIAVFIGNAERKLTPVRGSRPGQEAFEPRPSEEPVALQKARLDEGGRGRKAISPTDIPARGWRDILWRTYNQIGEDRILAVSAGTVFYLLLAMFPALAAFVSLFGIFADSSTIAEHLSAAAQVMPTGGVEIIREHVTNLTKTPNETLGFAFLFGLALALWSANAGMLALIDALNVVYDEKEKRSYIRLYLTSFAFTIGALAFLLFAIASIVVLPTVIAALGLDPMLNWLRWLRWPALMLATLFIFAVIYRYGPSRREARWRWLTLGSVLATTSWLVGSFLLSWYLANFAHYDKTYGSLGAAIGLMMWLWLTTIVVLVGAQLNAEMEHQTGRDTAVGPEKPLGTRGATMADTVGEAWR